MKRLLVSVWIIAMGMILQPSVKAVEKNDPGISFREFQAAYPLKPVRGYTFLGTENSSQTVEGIKWSDRASKLNRPLNKPCVFPDGSIDGWFNPGEHVPWVAEAMKNGQYEFGLVDGYLPAVRYVYRKTGTDATCEMTAFAVDGEKPGAIFIHVALREKAGTDTVSARYFRLGSDATASEAEFNTALEGLRTHWEDFFARGAQIPIPDPDVMLACKASIIRALITYAGTRPRYGVLVYGLSEHDGFPPTTIAMVDCLLDWGQTDRALQFMTDYFNEFVGLDGRIKYYGPSIAEYGQLLWLSRKCVDAGAPAEWFEHLRPKLDAIRQWLWAAQADGPEGLIKGSPEADKRDQVEVFFHNNGWAWRGLRDMAPLLGHAGYKERGAAFKQTIREAVEKATDSRVSPPFIPPKPGITPFTSMTENDLASYTNYRYWLELLSSGVLGKEQSEAIIDYRKSHGGEIGGMTRFYNWADNWPIAEYAAALFNMGRLEDVETILYSHLAGHMTPETWTAYEQVFTQGATYRRPQADYCVPSQLIAPRLAAWLWGEKKSAAKTYDVQRVKYGSIQVDGKLDEEAWKKTERETGFTLPWENAPDPGTAFYAVVDDRAFYFAFEVRDETPVVEETYEDEMTLTKEDRVELYLACDDALKQYYCIEVDPYGRVLDYSASHYRVFDNSWSFPGLEVAASRAPNGYQVEGRIPLAELEKLGLLRSDREPFMKAGLYRADLRKGADGKVEEHWLSWVDPALDEPDFHVPETFGVFNLIQKNENER